MSWRKTLGRFAWACGVVAMAATAASACFLRDLDYDEPCLYKSSYSYDSGFCALLREKCWDSSEPPAPGSSITWDVDMENDPGCIAYKNRYPEDNPNPDIDGGTDGGTDGGFEDPDGGGGGNGSGGDGGADASAAKWYVPPGYSCIPRAPDFFDDPQPVWIGANHLVPAGCPHKLGAPGGLSYFDLHASAEKTCPQCSCESLPGSCSAGMASLYLRDVHCNESSSTFIDFNLPAGWGDSCSPDDPVSLDPDCSANGTPCIKSIATGMLALPTNESCKVVQAPKPTAIDETPVWGQAILSCNAEPNDDIAHEDWETCIPSDDKWRTCVRAPIYGKHECNLGSDYRDQFIVYPNDAIVDERTCTACECSVNGGSCKAELTISSDDSCADQVVTVPVDSNAAHCADILPNTQSLGSKKLTKLEYVPGMCEARGGEASGTVRYDEAKAITWCCLRLDYVRPPLD